MGYLRRIKHATNTPFGLHRSLAALVLTAEGNLPTLRLLSMRLFEHSLQRLWPRAITASGTRPQRIPTEIRELFLHREEGLLRVGQCRSNPIKGQCQPSWGDVLPSRGPVHFWLVHG